MGILGLIKHIHKEKKREKQYCAMGIEQLAQLTNRELLQALSARILVEEAHMETKECLRTFKGAKRVFYIVNYFDMEIQNGGLCQFFVNSSREVAPYVLECLEVIGANEYKMLLHEFTTKNRISLVDLKSFNTDDIADYEAQTKRYPFDDFDDAYSALNEKKPLEVLLLKYSKKNLQDFT